MAPDNGTRPHPAAGGLKIPAFEDEIVRQKYELYCTIIDVFAEPLIVPLLPALKLYLAQKLSDHEDYAANTDGHIKMYVQEFLQSVLPVIAVVGTLNDAAVRLAMASLEHIVQLIGGQAVVTRVEELRSTLASMKSDPTVGLPKAISSLLRAMASQNKTPPSTDTPNTP